MTAGRSRTTSYGSAAGRAGWIRQGRVAHPTQRRCVLAAAVPEDCATVASGGEALASTGDAVLEHVVAIGRHAGCAVVAADTSERVVGHFFTNIPPECVLASVLDHDGSRLARAHVVERVSTTSRVRIFSGRIAGVAAVRVERGVPSRTQQEAVWLIAEDGRGAPELVAGARSMQAGLETLLAQLQARTVQVLRPELDAWIALHQASPVVRSVPRSDGDTTVVAIKPVTEAGAVGQVIAACRSIADADTRIAAAPDHATVYLIAPGVVSADRARQLGAAVERAAVACYIGVGAAVDAAALLPRSRMTADEAVAVCEFLGERSTSFDAAWLPVLARRVHEAVRSCDLPLSNPVARLAANDAKRGTHLLETLRVWLQCDRDFRKASERLRIHINTLRYRVAQAQQVMQLSLDETCHRRALELLLLDL